MGFPSAVWIPRAGWVGVLVAVASVLSLQAVQRVWGTNLAGTSRASEHAVVDDAMVSEDIVEPAVTNDPIGSSEGDESADAAGV